MIRKQYETILNASKEQVWDILWGSETYPKWTAAFSEGSKVETDWKEGGKVLFLNGDNEGMVSRIEEKKENQKMVFRHLGIVDKNGNEDRESQKIKDWQGAEEIYTLTGIDGKTKLTVEMDMSDEHKEFFDKTWPKVFQDLKNLIKDRAGQNGKNLKMEKNLISIGTTVHAPIENVWEYWTTPKHIKQWNNASDDWHTPSAENDLRESGKFLFRMEARDGSEGFDFEGTYDRVEINRTIAYTMPDGRKVEVIFRKNGQDTAITENFEPENTFPVEMQREGWQAILNNFKGYTESKTGK